MSIPSTDLPASAEEKAQSIVKSLLKAREKREDGEYFVPTHKLKSICHFDAVYQELRKHISDDTEAKNCAKYVCGPQGQSQGPSSRKIFAILTYTKYLPFIPEFKDAGVSDEHLPFRWNQDQTMLLCSSKSSSKTSKKLELNLLEGDPLAMDKICKEQWLFHGPWFGRDAKTIDHLHYNTIMPWTDFQIIKCVKTYRCIELSRVEIHQDYHNFSHNVFALKKFSKVGKGYGEDTPDKIRTLRKTPEGPHVIEICTTFTFWGNIHLLMPWAHGGSLKALWRRAPSSLMSSADDIGMANFVRWLTTQAHGLMCALKTISLTQSAGAQCDSEYDSCCEVYGDLKPENILYYREDNAVHRLGTLKIDVGNRVFFSLSKNIRPDEWKRYVSPTYQSPELDSKSPMWSYKVDIWAMGCIFSEMLTWALLEDYPLVRYKKAREQDEATPPNKWDNPPNKRDNFFRRITEVPDDEDGVEIEWMLKPSVSQCLTNLMNHASSGQNHKTFVQEFLFFIKEKMLAIDKDERASFEEVSDFFESRLEKLKSGTVGLFFPHPPTMARTTRVKFAVNEEEAWRS